MMQKERATAFVKGNRLYVRPDSNEYEMIYRAAMGVYWDKEENALYYKGASTDIVELIEIMREAVKKEYGVNLAVDFF